MKKLLLFLFTLITFQFTAHATHFKGGDLSWECIQSGPDIGKYKFILTVFRNCNGASFPTSQTIKVENSTLPNISVTRVSAEDISPKCYDPASSISCSGSSPEAVERLTYESAAITLNGTPPSDGWIFTWTSCCWATSMDNITGSPANVIRSIMYPYKGRNANVCYDSSPRFAADPLTTVCTDYTMAYNHRGVDPDWDELTFEFVSPLASVNPIPSGTNVTFATGYSANSPFPDVTADPSNVPAVMDSETGEITYTSHTTGSYLHGVKVTSYREGVKIAEVFRDIPVEMVSCGPLPAPFSTIFNVPPDVTFTYGSFVGNSLNITASPGDTVRFNITGTDAGLLPGLVSQSTWMKPSGQQFGNRFSDATSGCLVGPCATLDTTTTSFKPSTLTWEGLNQVSTNFEWVIDNAHGSDSGIVHLFYFEVQDDYCHVPGQNYVTAAIKVVSPSSFIKGKVFDDLNSDGVQDPGEPGIPRAILDVQPGARYYTADASGEYCIKRPHGTYQVDVIAPRYHTQTLPTPPSGYTAVLTPSSGNSTGNDFGVHKLTNVNDVSVSLGPVGSFRPGRLANYRITYRNDGVTTLNGDVELTYDNTLSFTSASVPFSSHTGNVMKWSYTNLQPGDIRNINVSFGVGLSAMIGDSVFSSILVNPIVGDTTPADNRDSSLNFIVNSYDPNIKEVSLESVTDVDVQNGQRLTYTIHFQNTGNAPAIDIVIEDTVEAGLELSSFRMLSASHGYDYQILGDYIRWTFTNINLPDSVSNEPESHGFVKFSILMNDTLVIGDKVKNDAFIYFDNNVAVRTPYAITEVEAVPVVGINDTTFTIDENVPSSTVVGTLNATGEGLTFTILSGNTGNAFRLDQTTGVLSVMDSASVDFEINPSFILSVEARDGSVADLADVTINVNDILDSIVPGIELAGSQIGGMKLFPNPSKENVRLVYQLPNKSSDAQVVIYDLQGKIERQYALVQNSSKGTLTIDREGLSDGVYLVELRASGKRVDVQRMSLIP